MKLLVATLLLGTTLLYAGLVYLFGFEGGVAYTLHFIRTSLAASVLFLYVPIIYIIFEEVPPPRRDYLLAGIILSWLSNVSFSTLNSFGRVFEVDGSIFTSPWAGYFSLMVVVAAIFHFIVPETTSRFAKISSVVGGVVFAGSMLFVLPLIAPFLKRLPSLTPAGLGADLLFFLFSAV